MVLFLLLLARLVLKIFMFAGALFVLLTIGEFVLEHALDHMVILALIGAVFWLVTRRAG